jgi:hypothetical protein
MSRNKKTKHNKRFPKCCGQPMKVEQGTGKSSREVKVYCEICREVLRHK